MTKKKTATPKSDKSVMTIGQVLSTLQGRFPDLTISKIRFLETQGLVSPERSGAGYRRFSETDLARLAAVLRMQKEEYLPLAVIKERLSGALPPGLEMAEAGGDISLDGGDSVDLGQALSRLGVSMDVVGELEAFGLISPNREGGGIVVSRADYEILAVIKELSAYGIEPRHLKMYKNFASREAQVFHQIIAPQVRKKDNRLTDRARRDLGKLAELTAALRRLLLLQMLAKMGIKSD